MATHHSLLPTKSMSKDNSMPSTMRPHLRAVAVERIRHRGAPYFLVSDPQGVAAQQLLVPVHFGGILALCDGLHDLATVVEEASALYNSQVNLDEARELIEALEEAGMLEGATFDALHKQAVVAWRAQVQRPLSHAGAGYPSGQKRLWRLFQEYLEAAPSVEQPAEPLDWGRGVALLSPHIDYGRGGAVYAQVWKSMAQAARDADVAVVFATDHRGDDPFTLTNVPYATPYGKLSNDRRLFDSLVEAVGTERAFAGELRHGGEHSIELVVNWLHHMREGKALPIVPVLTGSLQRFLRNGGSPKDDFTIGEVIDVVRYEMQKRKVLVIASGDMAHVGPAFGGAPLFDREISSVRKADERLVRAMESGDPDCFFAEIKAVGDCNNVCGVAPIYLAMRAAQGVQGIQEGYAVCPADDENTSFVTISGVRFTQTS